MTTPTCSSDWVRQCFPFICSVLSSWYRCSLNRLVGKNQTVISLDSLLLEHEKENHSMFDFLFLVILTRSYSHDQKSHTRWKRVNHSSESHKPNFFRLKLFIIIRGERGSRFIRGCCRKTGCGWTMHLQQRVEIGWLFSSSYTLLFPRSFISSLAHGYQREKEKEREMEIKRERKRD